MTLHPPDEVCEALNASANRIGETFQQLDGRAVGVLVIAFRDMGAGKLGVSYHVAGQVPHQLDVARMIIDAHEAEAR